MDHFGVKLDGIELPLLIGDRREGSAFRGADHMEACRKCRDSVAVAHPDLMAFALLPHIVKERTVSGYA